VAEEQKGLRGRLTRPRGARSLQFRRIRLNLVVVAAANLLALVTGPILARGLGPAGRGALAAALLWPQVVYLLFSFGVSDSVTYFASRAEASARAVRETALALALRQTLAMWIVGLPVVYLTMHHFGHSNLVSAYVYLAAMPAEMYGLYMLFLLNGLHRYRWFSVIQLQPFATTAAALTVLYLLGDLTVRSAVIVNAVSWILLALSATVVAHMSTRGPESSETSGLRRALLRFGLRSWVSNVPHALNDQVDQLVISLVLAPRQLGLYVIASTIATAPSFAGAAVANTVLPTVAASRGPDRVRAVRQSIVITFAMTATAGLAVVAIMDPLVRIIFGHAFLGAVRAARLLSVAAVFQAETRVFHGVLKGLGHPTDAAVSEAGALVVTGGGLAALVPLIGIMGGAVTSLAAYATSTLIAARYASHRLDVRPLALVWAGAPSP
jgi:O-antigen/teichoic acid export membrane protein